MKKTVTVLAAIATLGLSACTSTPCCSNPNREVVYVEKPTAQCTYPVQRVAQVSPCEACGPFSVTFRTQGECVK